MSSESPLAIGLDVGTQGARAMAVAANGDVKAEAHSGWQLRRGGDGRHEQDPQAWATAVLDVLGRIAPSIIGEEILGLAVTSTSGSMVVVDRAGEVARPAIMWDDTRAQAQVHTLEEEAAPLEQHTGLRLRPSFPLAKLQWLRDEEPSTLERASKLLHESDWVLWWLGGKKRAITDPTNALKSGYDPTTNSWASVVERRGWLGLMPEVVPAGTVVGVLSREISDRTGLAANIPLVTAMTDANSATLAAGLVRPGDWSSTLGTGLSVKAVSPRVITDGRAGVYSHAHPNGGWLASGTSHTGGGVVTQRFGSDQSELDRLAVAASTVPAGAALDYPLIGRGEFFPFWAPQATGFTVGRLEGRPGEFRATLEGIAVVESLSIDRMVGIGAPGVERLIALGGSTRSEFWNTIRASVQGRPITTLQRRDTAIGAAITVAASRFGDFAAAATAMVRYGPVVEPDPALAAAYEPLKSAFVREFVSRGYMQN